ncbi:DUF3826 domain-containing protein [Paludibacter sp.]|uniref:DUF3826 domain-containing protein n=1 Tax=Paludibacter sp. TaxID=1898105 RepID=UPI00135521A2|nr:DUF3826 domain-containing protein [Paludibacter sp.]MTK52702.1 DUF3826 domain-containing protein [Paludibacter sp.]
MKKNLMSLFLLLIVVAIASAQNNEDKYNKTLTDRAEKIVKTLSISDSTVFKRLTGILVYQYKSLGKIHDGRDAAIKSAKEKAGNDKATFQSAEKALQDEANSQLYNLHCEFIGKLAGDLNAEQIDKVKDGMVFNLIKVTYSAYLDMIPTLKPEEKQQIYCWLVEARERAMDAQSSNKKHEIFGKYKGRINNYLSKQGYNLDKERQAWGERLKAAKK